MESTKPGSYPVDSQTRNSTPNSESLFKSIFRPGSVKRKACEEMAKAQSPAEYGAALNTLIQSYYSDVLGQARWSFYSALGASVIAALFFLGAVGWTMQSSSKQQTLKTAQTTQPEITASSPSLNLIAGALVEVIAGINFYLYARTSRQLAAYHICLERTNRFLLANSISEGLSSEDLKQSTKEKLIETMMNAPMLTIAQATGTMAKPGKEE